MRANEGLLQKFTSKEHTQSIIVPERLNSWSLPINEGFLRETVYSFQQTSHSRKKKKFSKVEFKSTKNPLTIIGHGQEETSLSIRETLNKCQGYSEHHIYRGD